MGKDMGPTLALKGAYKVQYKAEKKRRESIDDNHGRKEHIVGRTTGYSVTCDAF